MLNRINIKLVVMLILVVALLFQCHAYQKDRLETQRLQIKVAKLQAQLEQSAHEHRKLLRGLKQLEEKMQPEYYNLADTSH